jgi:hypothetical protein
LIVNFHFEGSFLSKAQRTSSKDSDTRRTEASAYATYGHEGSLVIYLQYACTSSEAERGMPRHFLSLSISSNLVQSSSNNSFLKLRGMRQTRRSSEN